jgi:hypothetical protein
MDNLENDHIKALELAYSKLVQPNKLIELFNSPQEFKEWTELGTVSDLRACLIAFEQDELYDHCVVIKETLNQKENGSLTPKRNE